MEQKVKLSPKKLEVITTIQTQKNQLNAEMQRLNEKESIVVSMVMEDNNIVLPVKSVKIEGDSLVFDLVEKTPAKPKKAKFKAGTTEEK